MTDIIRRAVNAVSSNRPYLHFWRCQFEKLLVVALVAGAFVRVRESPDHPWNAELKVFVSQAIGILLWMLRGTWKNPENGEGIRGFHSETRNNGHRRKCNEGLGRGVV